MKKIVEQLESKIQPPQRGSSASGSMIRLGIDLGAIHGSNNSNNVWHSIRDKIRHPWVMVPCAIIAALGHSNNPIVKVAIVLPYFAIAQKP